MGCAAPDPGALGPSNACSPTMLWGGSLVREVARQGQLGIWGRAVAQSVQLYKNYLMRIVFGGDLRQVLSSS